MPLAICAISTPRPDSNHAYGPSTGGALRCNGFQSAVTITIFSAYPFEQPSLLAAVQSRHHPHSVEAALTLATTTLARGSQAAPIFINDDALAPRHSDWWAASRSA